MLSAHLAPEMIVIFTVSVAVCLMIIASEGLHIRLTERRGDTNAVQSAHVRPTPRIGGLALIASLVPIAMLLPEDLSSRFWLFTISVLPVALAGLAEDLGHPVPPIARLFAAGLSSVFVILILEIWLPRADVIGIDHLMAWKPFAWMFTVFACAGICNAFNLIDGLNGLSSGIGVITAVGLAAIASNSGQTSFAELNLFVAAALLGFLVFNFPLGRIFLGDVGAYSLGHILAWSSIGLLIRVPELSTWAVLLVFFWPVADTLFAIYRRRRAGRPTDRPDRLHYHQLVMRALEIMLIGRKHRSLTNPLATLIILPMAAAPALAGVMFWNQPLQAFLTLCLSAAAFVASYALAIRIATGVRAPKNAVVSRSKRRVDALTSARKPPAEV